MARNTVGARQHTAIFTRHNGTVDAAGNPTYSVANDWLPINAGWPCERVAVTGGETLRGRQVTAETTHVLFGWWNSVKDITAADQVQIAGLTYSIVSVLDADGDNMTARIQCKREA